MQTDAEAKELDQNQLFQLLLSHMPTKQDRPATSTQSVKQEPTPPTIPELPSVLPEKTTITFQKKQLLLSPSNASSAALSLSSEEANSNNAFQNVLPTWGNILTNSVRTTGIKDGSKWRKYGQKVIKNSAFPKNYFKCTVENCPAKKYVEKVIDTNGQPAIKTLYVDKHIHEGPDFLSLVILTQEEYDKSLSTIFTDESDTEESETRDLILELNCGMNIETTNDGRYWRKYGQKNVKGSAFPRSYYKCTHMGASKCRSKKITVQVDHNKFIYTYEGRHNHANSPGSSNGVKREAHSALRDKKGAVAIRKTGALNEKRSLSFRDQSNMQSDCDEELSEEMNIETPMATQQLQQQQQQQEQQQFQQQQYFQQQQQQQQMFHQNSMQSNINYAMGSVPSNSDPNSRTLYSDYPSSQMMMVDNMKHDSNGAAGQSNAFVAYFNYSNGNVTGFDVNQQHIPTNHSPQRNGKTHSNSSKSHAARGKTLKSTKDGGYGNNFVSHPSLPNSSYFVSNATLNDTINANMQTNNGMLANSNSGFTNGNNGYSSNSFFNGGSNPMQSSNSFTNTPQIIYPVQCNNFNSNQSSNYSTLNSYSPTPSFQTNGNDCSMSNGFTVNVNGNNSLRNSNSSSFSQKMCGSPSQRLQSANYNSNNLVNYNSSGASSQANMIHYPQYYPPSYPNYVQQNSYHANMNDKNNMSSVNTLNSNYLTPNYVSPQSNGMPGIAGRSFTSTATTTSSTITDTTSDVDIPHKNGMSPNIGNSITPF